MSHESTPRLALPLLQPGQAQKELDHNEALALLDIATMPVVESVGLDIPPSDPAPGQCWATGATPTGAWAGHAYSLAGWTDGGWRFVLACEGTAAWSRADGVSVAFRAGDWLVGVLDGRSVVIDGEAVVGPRRPPINGPAGGATIDAECRAAVAGILDALQHHGLIAI